jgi:hypothetical protein
MSDYRRANLLCLDGGKNVCRLTQKRGTLRGMTRMFLDLVLPHYDTACRSRRKLTLLRRKVRVLGLGLFFLLCSLNVRPGIEPATKSTCHNQNKQTDIMHLLVQLWYHREKTSTTISSTLELQLSLHIRDSYPTLHISRHICMIATLNADNGGFSWTWDS